MTVQETLGRALGVALAPLTGAGSLVRRARVFHPDGVVYGAAVTPIGGAGLGCAAASRLAGPALVRVSAAIWKAPTEWPDILGVSIRFREDDVPTPVPSSGDQDLLFATVRRPWALPVAPLLTNPHSFLCNDYHGVSPFDVPGLGRAYLTLLAPRIASGGRPRADALDAAVEQGVARFELWACPGARGASIEPLVSVQLLVRVPIDQEALRFDPFRTGRGVVPRGLIHNLRRATYAASQWARPRTECARGKVIPIR